MPDSLGLQPTIDDRRKARSRGWPVVLAVFAIAAVAVFLRFWRIRWGLASMNLFADERYYWREKLDAFVPLSRLSFLPQDLTYPTLLHAIAGSAIAANHALGLVTAGPNGTLTPILVARAVSAMAGLATVALVGVVGRRAFSARAGLAAAALIAVAPLEAMQTHYVSVDVLTSCCGVAALLAALELEYRDTILTALVAGVLAGLAFTAKYTGLAFVVAPLWAAVEIAWRRRSPARFAVLGLTIAAGIALAQPIGCPQCVLRGDLMLKAMALHLRFARGFYWCATNNWLAPSLGWYGRPYLYELVASLPWGLGWPLYLLGLAGIVRAIREWTAADRLIVVLLGAYFAIIGSSYVTWPRYLLPLYPGIAILAGRWVAEGTRRVRARAAVFVAVLVYTFVLTSTQVARFSWDQQQALSVWLRSALVDGNPSAEAPTVAFPNLAGDYFNLANALHEQGLTTLPIEHLPWFSTHPAAFVLPDWFATGVRRDRTGTLEAAELDRLESGAAGYRPVAQWRSRYLQESFYTWLDPGFAADLWQGETGFTIYMREDLVPRSDDRS